MPIRLTTQHSPEECRFIQRAVVTKTSLHKREACITQSSGVLILGVILSPL
uniref:Uncharacterized protein n=1 Tax=Anguilla anguilla TaxID=7936 RepID=A0A0E9XGJ6_ANGAN